jgi:threonine/homoserine/homoserine lactone efflux protein
MPGPDIIYVIMQSISNGKKYGIVTALGLVAGIIVHTTYIAFGLAALINKSDTLFMIIKIFGAFYLFFLAYKTWRSSADINLDDKVKIKPNLFKLFKQGFVMNVLNPKVALFFLAFFPGFIVPSNGSITLQIYILGLLFMVQAFLVFTFVSVISDRLTGFLRNNLKFEEFLKWFQIIVFIAIGFFILFSKK